jgi:hypothetical protein
VDVPNFYALDFFSTPFLLRYSVNARRVASLGEIPSRTWSTLSAATCSGPIIKLKRRA